MLKETTPSTTTNVVAAKEVSSRSRASKKDPHDQIQLVCPQTVSLDGKCPQGAELGRKKKIGTRAIDEIDEFAPVAGDVGREISRSQTWTKGADIGGVSAVLSGSGIDLKRCRGLEFELGPATG